MAAPPPPPGPPPGPPPRFASSFAASSEDVIKKTPGRTSIAGRRLSLQGFQLAFAPSVGGEVDSLGLGDAPPPPPGASGSLTELTEAGFDPEDLFTIDDVDGGAGGDLLVAGEGLTSLVLREDESGGALDWASELLLLTHEPMRRDMLEMQRALQTRFFGELPEGWRVRSFFRFFTAWCALVSQQHAIEVQVHYDWLAAPTGKMLGEQRQELLSYHRSIELELLAISRLEKKIIDELAGAADWTTSEPWSEQAQALRDRLNKLCAEIRIHLATQETILPDMLREHWGRVSPPQLVDKSLAAAKRAQANAAKGPDKPKMLMWMVHYLERRSQKRAHVLVSKLPFTRRMAFSFGRMLAHQDLLDSLRAIIDDKAPKEAGGPQVEAEVSVRPSRAAGDDDDEEDEDATAGGKRGGAPAGTTREKQRRAGMVNAVLAAANARRVDVPLNDNQMSRALAASEDPLHTFKMDGKWVNSAKAVPDNLYKKIGLQEAPEPPRRL